MILVAALVVVVLVGERDDTDEAAVRRGDTPVVDLASSSSAAWYCAAGTSAPDTNALETVRISNLGEDTISAVVRVLPGGDEVEATASVEVAPHSTLQIPVANVLVTANPGVVVETFGGSVFVEYEMVRPGDVEDVAFTPCAATTDGTWLFANGSTAQGATQRLVLFNPFAGDASVDISFLTEAGFSQPERLQGLTVPRESRVSIPVDTEIGRSGLVATRVDVRVGRVVAEQVLILDGSETVAGRSGLAVGPGASDVSEEWVFPWAGPVGGADFGVAIANFDTTSTEATISIVLDGEATIEDQVFPVPPRAVTYVNLAPFVPDDLGASAIVRVGAPVLVEQWASGGGRIATGLGLTRAATQWAFSDAGDFLGVFNDSDATAEVVVRTASGVELARHDVAAGQRLDVLASALTASAVDAGVDLGAGPIVVSSDVGVYVVRVGSLTVSPGVVVP